MSCAALHRPRPHHSSAHCLRATGGSKLQVGGKGREGGEGPRLFESNRLQFTFKRESGISERDLMKGSNKVITTDDSNGFESRLHESILVSENRCPNQEYFHVMTFKDKRHRKGHQGKGQEETARGRLDELSDKVRQLKRLVRSQEREVRLCRQSMGEKELRRLVKIHSIEKLKLLEEIRTVPAFKRKAA